MKTNEEFLEGIYGKRDALVKKRKKQMSVITTALCAVICVAVVATAGLWGGEEEPNKVVEIYKTIMKSGASVTQHQFGYADEDFAEDAAAEPTTAGAEEAEQLISAEVYTKPTKPAADGAADYKTLTETFTVKTETVTERLTVAPTAQNDNYALETPDSGGDSEDAAPTMPLPESSHMHSAEEIIEAAYNALAEDVRQYVIKDSAEAFVTRYADGTHTYEVYFRTTQDQYMGIKLDSELNKIPFKGDD